MMAVDSSALAAIALGEPGSDRLKAAFEAEAEILIGVPVLAEAHMVLRNAGAAEAGAFLEALCSAPGVRPIAFEERHWRRASRAIDEWGALNFGDALSYAIAREADAPLLFVKGDFRRTDVKIHPASAKPS